MENANGKSSKQGIYSEKTKSFFENPLSQRETRVTTEENETESRLEETKNSGASNVAMGNVGSQEMTVVDKKTAEQEKEIEKIKRHRLIALATNASLLVITIIIYLLAALFSSVLPTSSPVTLITKIIAWVFSLIYAWMFFPSVVYILLLSINLRKKRKAEVSGKVTTGMLSTETKAAIILLSVPIIFVAIALVIPVEEGDSSTGNVMGLVVFPFVVFTCCPAGFILGVIAFL